ncbi:MAG: hypothetical protein GF364_22765 [Candidatus Lokiarchaeota archaeon]|nr:hypothetical protein [Candidatus Lokiarchaeota archaeon]
MIEDIIRELDDLDDRLDRLEARRDTHYKGTSATDFTTTTLPHHGDYGFQTTDEWLQMNMNGGVYEVGVKVYDVTRFGATGDGVTDDSSAIQDAIDAARGGSVSASGANAAVYFPAGTYVCDSPLDLTGWWYFRVMGDSWENTVIESHATGKAAIELLGSRFFVIENLTVEGDTTDTPDVGFFLSRATLVSGTGPNCGNCWFDHVAVAGEFTHAGFYQLNAEVLFFNGCRSTAGFDADYYVYSSPSNDDSITSDYRTIDVGTTGSTMQSHRNFHIASAVGINFTPFYYGDVANTIILRDGYWQARGTGVGVQLDEDHFNVTISGIMQEGNATELLDLSTSGTCDVRGLTIENVAASSVTKAIDAASGVTINGLYLASLTVNQANLDFYNLEHSTLAPGWYGTLGNAAHTVAIAGDITDCDINLNNQTYSVTGTETNVRLSEGNDDEVWVREADFSVGVDTARAKVSKILEFSGSWDPGTVADGDVATNDFTATNVATGDFVIATVNQTSAHIHLEARAITDKIRLSILNESGGNYAPGSKTWSFLVFKTS